MNKPHTYNWLDYFMGLLEAVRKKSKDPTTEVRSNSDALKREKASNQEEI